MLRITTAIAALIAVAGPAVAQDYPNRPVTVVVPYAAGGPVDTVARIAAARMSEILGQQMVIENVGGAGGMTGSARVAKAAPDGYTCCSRAAPCWRRCRSSTRGRSTTRSPTSIMRRCSTTPPAC